MSTLDKQSRQWLNDFGEKVVARAIQNLDRANKKASGKLRNQLGYQIKKQGTGYELRFTAKTREVREYADVVEKGRRKGARQPPPDPLMQWIKVKNIPLKDAAGNTLRRTQKNLLRTAWAMSRSISRKGIKGIFYMQRAVDFQLRRASPELLDTLNKLVSTRIALKKYNKQ